MSPRLQQLMGGTLLLTALAFASGAVLGDPTIESHGDRERFVEQVENAADRIPVIYAFQDVEVASGFLALAAGVGLYLMLRERARGTALAGLLLFVLSCVSAWEGRSSERGCCAPDDYVGGGLTGIGSGSEDVLTPLAVTMDVLFPVLLRGDPDDRLAPCGRPLARTRTRGGLSCPVQQGSLR